jgi:hypothetical protein
MREVVLDVVDRASKAVAGECFGEQLGQLPPFATVPKACHHQGYFGRMAQDIANLAQPMSPIVHIGGDMIYIAKPQTGFSQAVSDRLRRKPRPMLDAPKPLFFRRRNQRAVFYESRR